MGPRVLDEPVQIVAGKGGVGRTTIAAALALRASREGHRTLLLEVDAPDSATRALNAQPAVDTPREVENNLWVCRMTPRGSLREYALLVLRFKVLYRLVFENELVRYLLRSIPSLGEVTMLGKAWWHATQEQREDGQLRFERVIIDAPATGHALTFLSVAQVVADAAPPGIMRDKAQQMANMVKRAVLHVVALPEEMPVNEALDLLAAIPKRVDIRPGLAIMNRFQPELFSLEERAIIAGLKDQPGVHAYYQAAERRRIREQLEGMYYERFAHQSGQSSICIPDLAGFEGLDLVEQVVAAIDREVGTPVRGRNGQFIDTQLKGGAA